MSSTALLALILMQAPQAAGTAPREQVIIELVNGGWLEGTIVDETDGLVELRIGGQSVVGFERSMIANIIRRDGEEERAAGAGGLEPRDEWFVLHDARGRVVGRMHSTVVEDGEGRSRVSEEWEFRDKDKTSGITLLEVVNADLTPVSSFFHERLTHNLDGRVLREELVRGVIEDDRFVVDKKGMKKPERRVYELDLGMRFPLSVLHGVRQRAQLAIDECWMIFDARTSEFARWTFASSQRTVQWRGEELRLTVVQHGSAHRQNIDWLNASGRTLRREINGPSLVAMPIAAEMTERYLMSAEPMFQSAVAVEPLSRFALWLPSPAWQADASAEQGCITVREPVHEASACLVVFEQIEAATTIDTVADVVTRWLHQSSDLVVADRERVELRGRDAVRLSGVYVDRVQGGPRRFRSEVFVFAAKGAYVALCFAAPVLQFEDVRCDFDRMLKSVDLFPEIDPEDAK